MIKNVKLLFLLKPIAHESIANLSEAKNPVVSKPFNNIYSKQCQPRPINGYCMDTSDASFMAPAENPFIAECRFL